MGKAVESRGVGARGGELLSECMATFIILGLGDSAAAMYTLYDPSPYQQAYWGVCIAWGLAVTPDESTALVTSAWTHQLSAVDLATAKLKWSIDVPREPRAVVVRADSSTRPKWRAST